MKCSYCSSRQAEMKLTQTRNLCPACGKSHESAGWKPVDPKAIKKDRIEKSITWNLGYSAGMRDTAALIGLLGMLMQEESIQES